jgi:hypothetical protein
MLNAKQWEHPCAVAILFESILPPAAQLLLLQSQQGDLVGIICGFRTSLREFLDLVLDRFA